MRGWLENKAAGLGRAVEAKERLLLPSLGTQPSSINRGTSGGSYVCAFNFEIILGEAVGSYLQIAKEREEERPA